MGRFTPMRMTRWRFVTVDDVRRPLVMRVDAAVPPTVQEIRRDTKESKKTLCELTSMGRPIVQGLLLERQSSLTETTTFAVSVFFQLFSLVLTIVALSSYKPEALQTILLLELAVGATEFFWYTAVGLRAACRGVEVSVSWRYADWFLTTPTMLVSVLFYIIWEHEGECLTTAEMVNGTPARLWGIPLVVLFDWSMLAVGLVYETTWSCSLRVARLADDAAAFLAAVATCDASDKVVTPRAGLWFGFVPFVAAFVPLVVILVESFTKEGLASLVITFAAWALYGVVAIYVTDSEYKNAAYNLLDILSKNAVGILIAFTAIHGNFTPKADLQCAR